MKILSGWKEMANDLHQGVRTVQRWESMGLPIHRVREPSLATSSGTRGFLILVPVIFIRMEVSERSPPRLLCHELACRSSHKVAKLEVNTSVAA
jgi:hypothetical protein